MFSNPFLLSFVLFQSFCYKASKIWLFYCIILKKYYYIINNSNPQIKKLGLLPCDQFPSVHTYYFALRLQSGMMPVGLWARKPVPRRKDNVFQSLHPTDSISMDCDRFHVLCTKRSWHEAHMTQVPCSSGLIPKYELNWGMLIPGKHPLTAPGPGITQQLVSCAYGFLLQVHLVG